MVVDQVDNLDLTKNKKIYFKPIAMLKDVAQANDLAQTAKIEGADLVLV